VTRTAGDRPCAGVAALARRDDGRIADLRVVVGAVSPVPVRLHAVEDRLRGGRVDTQDIASAAALAADAVDPLGDLRGSEWYKRQVVPVLVRRALEKLLGVSAKGE
jgi:carbon-monoxide dehydrogenase medium subunit